MKTKHKWLLANIHPCNAKIPSAQQCCRIFTSSLCTDMYIAQNLVILTLSPGHQWHSWSSHLQQTQRTPSCHPWLLAWRWGSVYKAAAHAETRWNVFLSLVSAQSGYGIFHWKKWRKSWWQMSHPSLPNSHVWFLSVTTSHSYSVYTTPSSLPPSKAASCLAFLSLAFSWTTLSQLHTAYTQQGAALWQSAAPLTNREWNVAPVHKCPHLRWSPCSSYKQSTLGDTCIHQPPTDRKGNSLGGPKPSSRCSSCFPLRLMCSFTSLRQVAVFHCRVLSPSVFPEPHPQRLVCRTPKQTHQHSKQSSCPRNLCYIWQLLNYQKQLMVCYRLVNKVLNLPVQLLLAR